MGKGKKFGGLGLGLVLSTVAGLLLAKKKSNIFGAVAVELLRKKKPELFDEIKTDAKDIAKSAKSIYKHIRTTVKDLAEDFA